MQDRDKKHNKERSQAYFKRRAEEIRHLNPKLFDLKKPSVLTKAIKAQIQRALPHVSLSVINKFLMYWVARDRYLTATTVCPKRMNLNGTFAEGISDAEREYARAKLQEKRLKKAPRTSKVHNRHKVKALSPSERNERQRAIMEKAGRGLNFDIAPPKPAVEVRIKKRRTLSLPKKDGDA